MVVSSVDNDALLTFVWRYAAMVMSLGGAPAPRKQNAEPPRPDSLPPHARWVEAKRCWMLAEGNSDAIHTERCYYDDGTPLSVQRFETGKAHGPFRRFHRNGDLAREGEFRRGELHGALVAYASAEPTREHLRACCVPPSAWTMRASYDNGRCQYEHFFNRDGERLLDDGSLFPPLPTGVPETARFLARERRWELGRYTRTGRAGLWRWWTELGELVEEAEYQEGRRHGFWRRFEGGKRVWDSEYRDGMPEGAHFETVTRGTFEDERVASIDGVHRGGVRCGLWQFRDRSGQVVRSVDYGEPCHELAQDHPVLALGATGIFPRDPDAGTAAALGALADGLRAANKPGLALLALLRQAWWSGSTDPVPALLQSQVVALTRPASEQRLETVRGSKHSNQQKLADYVQALLEGTAASRTLEAMASLLLDAPASGIELVQLAGALNQGTQEQHSLRALLLTELGHVDAARAEVAGLEARVPLAAQHLSVFVDAVFSKFEFWPSTLELEPEASDELPNEVEQTLADVRHSIAKCALRLDRLRAAIRAKSVGSSHAWQPPDLSALYSVEPVELESYQFEVTEEGQQDTVVVAEVPSLDAVRLTDLMRQARLDWIALSWLCWGAGLDRIAMPERLAPPSEFARALTTAFRRQWRAMDQLQTNGLRARRQRVPSFVWHGMPIEHLPHYLARFAQQEFLEMRSALFFLADGTCRSLWQDDLRV